MTIVATARVPRIFDLRFAPTRQLPRLFPRPAVPAVVEQAPCPSWCVDCWPDMVAEGERHHHGTAHVVNIAGLFRGERRDLVVQTERYDSTDRRPAFVYLAERNEEGFELTPDEAVDLAAALLAAAIEAQRAAR